MSTERRHHIRIAFDTPAQLSTPEQRCDVQVLDLSFKGALVALPAGWTGRVGDPCLLRIGLDPSDARIVMVAEVAHIEGSHAGLQCRSIDLDSVTQLRQLMSLNLSDPALLERELRVLAAG